jgi:hypothetical protein
MLPPPLPPLLPPPPPPLLLLPAVRVDDFQTQTKNYDF